LQELELAANVMLEQMGLIGWQLKYATEKETKKGSITRGLNVTVLSPRNDRAVKWECWSGGARQRLRLIGALALSEVLLARVGLEPSLEILDEQCANLSIEGIEDLVDYLHDRAAQLDRVIYLIEHHTVASSKFASTINVVKTTKGGTMIGKQHER